MISGATLLIYEIAATQALLYFFDSSSYSLATTLTSFLLGLSLGSLWISRRLDRINNKRKLFVILQLLTSVYAVAILTQYDFIPNILISCYPATGTSFWLKLVFKFLVGTLYLIIPTMMLGASFPLAVSLLLNDIKKAGQDVARLYSWDMFGAIAGTIVAGFWMIPNYGLTATFIFGAALNVIAALIMAENKRKYLGLTSLVVACIFIFIFFVKTNAIDKVEIPVMNPISIVDLETNSATEEFKWFDTRNVLFRSNTPYGEVAITEDHPGEHSLYLNRKCQCTNFSSTGETQLADLSISYHKKDSLSALNIGLGCGNTLQTLVENKKVNEATIVEINSVIPTVNHFFHDQEFLKNPKINLVIQNGFDFLRSNKNKFDIIVVDVEDPNTSHSSLLYTKDFFKLVSNSLDENGVFGFWAFGVATWEESGQINYEYLGIVYRTLRSVFPFVDFYFDHTEKAPVFIASKGKKYNGEIKFSEEEIQIKKKLELSDGSINTLDRNILAGHFYGPVNFSTGVEMAPVKKVDH